MNNALTVIWFMAGVTALSLLITSWCLWTVITAKSAWKRTEKLLSASSTRSLIELEAAVASLESTCSSNSTTIKRLSSRIGMQDVRERRSQESPRPPPNASPGEMKRWLQKGLASGSLKVLRDGHQSSNAEGG